MEKVVNYDLLREVKSMTKAYLETRRPLSLTPVEKTLLGLRTAPEVVNSSVVLLKCDYRSQLNDKRHAYGMPDLEPMQGSLPWGEWEIEDILIHHDDETGEHRYLRYYKSFEDSQETTQYFDAVSGEQIKGVLLTDIEHLLRRRHKTHHKFSSPSRIVDIEHVLYLYTLNESGEPDLKIIETQLD